MLLAQTGVINEIKIIIKISGRFILGIKSLSFSFKFYFCNTIGVDLSKKK